MRKCMLPPLTQGHRDTHTCSHVFTFKCTHSHMSHIHAVMHTLSCMLSHMLIHSHMLSHTLSPTFMQSPTWSHTYTFTVTYMFAHTHICTHSHLHAGTRTQKYQLLCNPPPASIPQIFIMALQEVVQAQLHSSTASLLGISLTQTQGP